MNDGEAAPWRWERRGRSRGTILTVVGVLLAVILARAFLDLAAGIGAAILLFAMPAVYDIATDRRSGVEVGPLTLRWFRPGGDGAIPLPRIDFVRARRRLDLSYRIDVMGIDGVLMRLPPDCTPPMEPFAEALADHGIRVVREPFSLL